MFAAAIFVSASPTARRADAPCDSNATGVRSPIDIASPWYVSNAVAVTATSATGTCHGPTIWSRLTRPVTERSPMVIRKVFSATVGKDKMRFAASANVIPVSSNAGELTFADSTSRCILGGLPKSTSRGISIGLLSN